MNVRSSTLYLYSLLVALGPVTAWAGAFNPGDHFVFAALPGGAGAIDYSNLSLSTSSNTCDVLGGCQTSSVTADISAGALHSYATASNGGGGGAVAALSAPVLIAGSVTVGVATITMSVHGSWQLGTFTPVGGFLTGGYAQYEGILYDFFNTGSVSPVDHIQTYGTGEACSISTCFIGTGPINDTLTLDVPFDLSVNPLIQLTGYLYATAGYESTMDLSHTATFSISVPAGDTYSTLLGSGTPVPEPSPLGLLATGLVTLGMSRRRR